MTDEIINQFQGNILVVDDNRADLRLLVEILDEEGYIVRPTLDSLSALTGAWTEPPDLILLDVNMPQMDGYEVCRQLKADDRTADLPVIFISASNEVFNKVKAFTAGGVDYITKPFQVEEVLARVKTHLNLRKKSEALLQTMQALQDTREQLTRHEKLAVLGELAGGVAHELRNPLGVISNAIYYLQLTHTEADHTTKEYLDIISSRVHDAERILSALLDFARSRPPQRTKTVMAELVAEVLAQHAPPQNIKVITNLSSDLPAVYVDPQQIRQVLINLVTNAYQAMPEGGELTFNPHIAEGWVQLTISDTGCGMTPETTAKIFEPLFSTKTQGIGLGLAVSKNLVEFNEGRLEVTSEPGKGSAFTITLPTREVIQ